MKSWVAIDPGANGSLCRLYEDGSTFFIDFKKGGLHGYIDYLSALLSAKQQITAIAIEHVASMSGQGVKSMFSFGQRLGELEGMLLTFKLNYTKIRPQVWQKACQIVPKSGKKGTFQVMSNLYPNAELLGPKGGILDGRCDALGIAHYLRFIS